MSDSNYSMRLLGLSNYVDDTLNDTVAQDDVL